MRSQKGVLLIVVMMIAIALGLFGNSEVWADSYCGVCKKVVSWTQISDCPDCGGYRSTCDSCGGCYHTCSGGGTSSGGASSGTLNPTVNSLTAVNNENSVTLKAGVAGAEKYRWSKDSVNQHMTANYGTSISWQRETITKTVSEAGTWYICVTYGLSKYDYDSINVYSVAYNTNNGSSAPATQYKAHGYDLKLTSSVPTKEGYAFLGWSTDSTATTATYPAGCKFR